LSSVAWAVSPNDALTGRPDSEIRLKLRLDNLENVKSVFDHPLMALYSTFLREEKTGGVMYALNLALGLQPKSVAFVVGKDGEQTFLQMAVSMPETAMSILNSIEWGDASKSELTAFLAEEAGAALEGVNGPYYFFKETVFLAARDNLLLIALTLDDLNASLEALNKAGVRRIV
jgi:hypothetical protein